MSKNCLLLKDIKNSLKKLECGQLEIEAGQWELHKDILNMKKTFDELKNFKNDFEEMKKSNVEQMGIIRNLELTLSQKPNNDCPKKTNNCKKTEDTCKSIDKRMTKNPSNDLKKKTHIVQSEEIIEITSHVESSESRSISDCKSEGAEERKGKREGKKRLRSPIRSIVYFRKLTSGSGILNTRIRFPPKKKDNAMLQRYLNDSAIYCDKEVSNPVIEVSKSAEICENSPKEGEQSKSDSWNWFNNKRRYSNSRDRSTERNFVPHDGESVLPKTAPHNKKRKAVVRSTYFNDKSKRKKKESTYVCGVCQKGFHTKDLLRAHGVVHRKMSGNSISYKCSYCNNVYKTPETLEKHTRKCQLIRSLFRKS